MQDKEKKTEDRLDQPAEPLTETAPEEGEVPETAPEASAPPAAEDDGGQEKKPQDKRELYEWVQALVCSVLAVVMLFTFVVRLIGVDGHSMVPTLQHGDRLLVLNSVFYDDYRYGDIVVLRKESFNHEPIVKRVIATEGQTVDIDFVSGSVYVDGVELDEPYINERTYREEGLTFPVTVPEGCVFVMGDNRNRSDDSRNVELGPVDTRSVIGKVVLLLFPGADELTEERDFGRIGGVQ